MNSNDTFESTQSRRPTSLGVILGAALAGFAAYYFEVPKNLMTYVMYMQENAKVKAEVQAASKEKLVGSDPNEVRKPGGLAPPGFDMGEKPAATPESKEETAKE